MFTTVHVLLELYSVESNLW